MVAFIHCLRFFLNRGSVPHDLILAGYGLKDSALSPLLYTYVALNYHLEITTFFVGTNVMDKTYEWTKSVQLFRLDVYIRFLIICQ